MANKEQKEVSLQELLESRDNRQARQRELIRKYNKTLVCLTIVMPGAVKRNTFSVFLFQKAINIIKEKLGEDIVIFYEYDLKTGLEAIFVVRTDALETKRNMCEIEDRHPLGRLFDIDVIGTDGTPLSRQNPRKCLLCDNNARICMRSGWHTQSDIQNKIKEMIDNACRF
ncbi:MAG: citrate lyase holo-[acyl-carrier protein] synthase [Bacteroidales bacterium]|nr:citrate lyase holo-[acyl-carrier protein] synthase [Bacteroidales bacterium]